MIEVERLSKWYGDFQAVRDVSFSVTGCQVAGFLGANGAGKTTTMRILACFLPATGGKARVAGFDIFTQSLQVRQSLGYMPQNAPLYTDMRVEEYLRFMAEMRDVHASRIRSAVDEAMFKSGLLKPEDMHRRLLGALSHGYQQRVALAACLLHKPKVLILDEPTAGLDPVEIRNTRNLIRGLGTECTVLLSTHILFEVQQICSKVIVVKQGAVVADASIDEIVRRHGRRRICIAVGAPADQVAGLLSEIEGVSELEPVTGGLPEGSGCGFVMTAQSHRDPQAEIGARIAQRQWPLFELRSQQETLEDVYVRMTMAER